MTKLFSLFRKNGHSLPAIAIAIFTYLMPGLAFAQPIPTVTVPLEVRFNGNPAIGILYELRDTSNNLLFSGTSDSNGIVQMANVPQGNFQFNVIPDRSHSSVNNGMLKKETRIVNVSTTNPFYNSISGNLQVPKIELDHFQRWFRLQVEDGSTGSPLNGAIVSAFRADTNNPRLVDTRTGVDGRVQVGVASTLTGPIRFRFLVDSPGFQAKSGEFELNTGVTETQAIIVLDPAAASIQLDFKDSNGVNFPIPAGVLFASAQCVEQDGGNRTFSKPLQMGATSTVIDVDLGQYLCSVGIEGYSSIPNLVTVVLGQAVIQPVTIVEKNSFFRFRAIDSSTGQLISGVRVEFFSRIRKNVTGPGIKDHEFGSTLNGTKVLPAVPGEEYEVLIKIPDALGKGAPESGTAYLMPRDPARVVAVEGTTVQVDFSLTPLDAQLTIELTDPEGAPAEGHAEVAFRKPSKDSSSIPQWISAPLQNGRATFRILSGRNYTVFARPKRDSDSIVIPPRRKEITLEPEESRTELFQYQEANHIVTINGAFSETADGEEEIRFFGCNAYDGEGRDIFLGTESGETSLQLALALEVRQEIWSLSCYSIKGSEDNFFLYLGEATYTARRAKSDGELNLTLQRRQSFYTGQSYQFDATEEQLITLPDGESTIEIPALAIGDSGTVTMTAKSAQGYTIDDEEYPLEVFDISFFLDGAEISEVEKPITLRIPLTAVQLEELGVTSNEILGATFNTDSSFWAQDDQFTYDEENEEVVITASHFSIWGTLIDVAEELRSQYPTNLKAKLNKSKADAAKKKHPLTLSWTAPELASADQQYELDVIVKRNSVSLDDWDSAKTYTVSKAKKKLRIPTGKHRFRVRMLDGKNSQEKTFRVRVK